MNEKLLALLTQKAEQAQEAREKAKATRKSREKTAKDFSIIDGCMQVNNLSIMQNMTTTLKDFNNKVVNCQHYGLYNYNENVYRAYNRTVEIVNDIENITGMKLVEILQFRDEFVGVIRSGSNYYQFAMDGAGKTKQEPIAYIPKYRRKETKSKEYRQD